MKKIDIVLIVIMFLCISFLSNNVFALTSNDLIHVGSGKYGITISSDTKIEDIIYVLGEPKIKTSSPFGGYAYTFYTDDNYSNYLYVETTSKEKIISFGSVDTTYKTNTYSYGDAYNYKENGALHGYILNNGGVVAGGVYYNHSALKDNGIGQTISEYRDVYTSKSTFYLKGLAKHSIAMYNALSINFGNKTNLEFNEDFFYINEQFKSFGSSIRNYLNDMDKSNYMKAVGIKENIEIAPISNYYVLNPMVFASFIINNKTAKFEDKNIAIFDYDIDKKLISAIGVKSDTFEKYNEIALTSEEQAKLSNGRYEYSQAIHNLNLESGLYITEPVSKSATNMVAGELKYSKKQGILNYVNAIRTAAGLQKFTINEHAFTIAQHISTLISYRLTELDLSITHMPEKPDGVSDSYYQIAIGDGQGYAENLGQSLTQSTENTMMHYINLFLDDRTDSPLNFSHREKLLHPTFTGFGYGISPYTFSNEFSGYRDSDLVLTAWPAEGITFLESLAYNKFEWTARFVDKYKVLADSTTVTVKCLNTNDIWLFNTEEKTDTRFFKRYTTLPQMTNNKVAFYDSTIVPERGYIYEVTIHNLLNESTNKKEDYTYRTVFEYADEANYGTTIDTLKIKKDNLVKVKDEEVYYVAVGEETPLSIEIDTTAKDKKLTWISSSEKVKVTQNGTIIPEDILEEDVTITVIHDTSNITDQIVVRPYNKIEQVKLEPNLLKLLKGDSSQIGITYIPANANEVVDIEWKVVSMKNKNNEYDISNPDIRRYIAADIIDQKLRDINVTAVDAEIDNNEYEVIVYVHGISGNYSGKCSISVDVPLEGMVIKYNNDNNEGLEISRESMIDPGYSTINYNNFYNNNLTDTLKLKVEKIPENATVSDELLWSTTNSQVLSDINNNGHFKISKDGESTVEVTNKETGIKAFLNINVESALEKIELSGTSSNVKLELDDDGRYVAQDRLNIERFPSVNNSKIIYESSNEEIATVDEEGIVTFKSEGVVTIKAKSELNSNIYSEYTYNVFIPVSQISFPSLIMDRIIFLKQGEQVQYEAIISHERTNYSRYIEYSSDNTKVATVNKNGVVNGISRGKAKITATIDGMYTQSGQPLTSSYYVEVGIPVESISVVDSITIIKEEAMPTLNVTINPSNYTDSVVVDMRSGNEDILTINPSSGKITALKSGKTNIYITVTATNLVNTTTFNKVVAVEVKSKDDPKYKHGDLDRNGYITANDAAIALDIYKNNNATDEDILIGDLDGNNIINAQDAAMILDMYKNGK